MGIITFQTILKEFNSQGNFPYVLKIFWLFKEIFKANLVRAACQITLLYYFKQTFIETLPIRELKKLVSVKYQCGVGSMEFIQSVLQEDAQQKDIQSNDPNLPQWCKCGKCREMQRDIENKCCNKAECITSRRKFSKFCLDPENLEMVIKNTTDIRNDRRDNSTHAFRKAGYRQFVLWQHGYLGKGNRKVVPSCAVLCIRSKYPSPTGIYMGFKEH